MKWVTWKTQIEDNAYRIQRGWGNGYVIIPKSHPFYEKSYDELNDIIDVHGGLTYSSYVNIRSKKIYVPELTNEDLGCWMIGFDTAHWNDTLHSCPKEYVILETLNLKMQVLTQCKPGRYKFLE